MKGNMETEEKERLLIVLLIRTLFVTPSFVDLPKISQHRYMLIATFSPHLSFDDMDKMISRAEETNSPERQMNLNVFLLLSDKDDTL